MKDLIKLFVFSHIESVKKSFFYFNPMIAIILNIEETPHNYFLINILEVYDTVVG